VLITGGAGGMGAAMARRFALSGARVAIVDLKPDAVADTSDRLRQEGLDVIGVAADTTDEESMAAGVAETVRIFGSLYGLVTAAGIRSQFHRDRPRALADDHGGQCDGHPRGDPRSRP
jgi:NAD(P)-dependent dehydrogenase (short-subunit alcohol dehydrogenase family)